jgi:hypothetical protein
VGIGSTRRSHGSVRVEPWPAGDRTAHHDRVPPTGHEDLEDRREPEQVAPYAFDSVAIAQPLGAPPSPIAAPFVAAF